MKKITKSRLRELIREELDRLVLEIGEEDPAQRYEYTSLTSDEKDKFAEDIGLADILRIMKKLELAGDTEAANAIRDNVADRLKDFTNPIMLKRLAKGRKNR